MKATRDNFKFFVPMNIEKGIDEEGSETMMISGVASTNRKDSQGEILDVNGFDLTNFSVINWNHKGKDDASAIIGEPTKAEIRSNKLYIEGMLYPEMPMAKAVFSLMKAYKNSPTGKKLGLSIEGKAIERDSVNPKKITRAKVTGVAVCPHPINEDTTVDLLEKGFTHDDFQFDEIIMSDIEKAKSFWELIDSNDDFKDYVASNTTQEDPYSISEEEREKLMKAFTAAGNVHVSKESVEHDPKNVTDGIKKNLSKSDVYEKIFDYFGPVQAKTATKLYSLVEKISIMDKQPISEETIRKAEEILNLSTEELIKKSGGGEQPISDDDEGGSEEKEYEGEEGVEKATAAAMSAIAKGEDEEEVVKSLIKGGLSVEKAKSIYKSCVSDASKNADGGSISTLKKSLDDSMDIMKGLGNAMDSKFSAMLDIIKSQGEEIKALGEVNKGLASELEAIGRSGAIRKSVPTVKAIDRFEKSEDGGETYQLSNKQSRGMLVSRINEIAGLNGGDPSKVNMTLARVAQDIELAQSISGPGVQLLKSHQIEVIK